jgi:hypothetical protein
VLLQRRRVRVRVHRGFRTGSPAQHFFVTVTNRSKSREIEITHVWFETTPRADVLNPDQPLPARLRPDEPLCDMDFSRLGTGLA